MLKIREIIYLFVAVLFMSALLFDSVHAQSNRQIKENMRKAVVGKTYRVGKLSGIIGVYMYLAPNGRAYEVDSLGERVKRSFWSVKYFAEAKGLAVCVGVSSFLECGSVAFFNRVKVADYDKFKLTSGKLDKSLFPKGFFIKKRKK